MLGLVDSPTPAQLDFPTRRALVFIFCQIKTGISIMIDFFIVMGAQYLVPLLLCCTAASSFLEAVGLLLDILIVVFHFL